ncbi:DMT family transporter [Pseudooceanicola sp.]|uniref:DMT family transporter n=1 Tax=Pseudooceanicola sp. TaxID=1914328 RepID=UPI0035C6F94B
MRDISLPYALLVVAAMACIVLGDTGGKTMTSQGISPYFAAWGRFALAAVALAPFAALTRADLPALRDWRVLLRTGLIVAGICAILTALKTEPIANVFGAFFVGPVVAYFGSALLLRERVTLIRATLLLIGFAGVLLVVKPGFGMSLGMAMALLAGTFYGSYLVATRLIAGVYRPRLLLFSQLALGALVLTPLAVVTWPATLPAGFAWAFPLSAFGSALGNYLLLIASRSLPANVVAPLVYSQILWAMLLGLAVFGDWPDALALIGLVVILASGLAGLRLAGMGR